MKLPQLGLSKYFRLYSMFAGITIKTMLEYRFNLIINSFYVLCYSFGLYGFIEILYSKTDHLMTFTKPELHIMLGLTMVYWTVMNLFYFEGFKFFMLSDVRTGQFDFTLLKPINAQFIVATGHPMVEGVFQLSLAVLYTSTRMWLLRDELSVVQVVAFCFAWLLCNIVIYNVVAIHATTAFYTTQSVQLLRLTQTLNDHAQFPTSLYSMPLRIVLTALFPVAFMAYVPALFLFGKASFMMAVYLAAALVISSILNSLSWRIGLQHYSSASS